MQGPQRVRLRCQLRKEQRDQRRVEERAQLPVQLRVEAHVELRVDERVGLRTRLRGREQVELRTLQRRQCPVELRAWLRGGEWFRLRVQLWVQVWVGRPPDAFSATYALSRASRVVNRPSPGRGLSTA